MDKSEKTTSQSTPNELTKLPDSKTSNNSSINKQQPPSFTRQNTVTTVNLTGVDIVALRIDGKERLCLAQISTTLLKRYSYNEIHNRRVALGITCVQCTPVQLEILRRAGAMPISSRRCGMITKREAERLVKSFLEENTPPKLPENFSFEVEHNCGWGCRGLFVPSRYNSSRAKCIKCTYCNMYFSPNKFIFHYHRMPDSKYTHPDAANFNSWRRHIVLSGEPAEELSHAWEDVKAMFNGGSRKRILCHVTSTLAARSNDAAKKPKMSTAKCQQNSEILTHRYNYPIFHPVKSPYPISPIPAHSTYVNYPYPKTFNPSEPKSSSYMPLNAVESQFGSYDFFWQSIGQKSLPVGTAITSPKFAFEAENELNRNNESAVERFYNPPRGVDTEKLPHLSATPGLTRPPYVSAFTPVGRHLVTSSTSPVIHSPRSDDYSLDKTEHRDIRLPKDEDSDEDADNIVIDVINDNNTDADVVSDHSECGMSPPRCGTIQETNLESEASCSVDTKNTQHPDVQYHTATNAAYKQIVDNEGSDIEEQQNSEPQVEQVETNNLENVSTEVIGCPPERDTDVHLSSRLSSLSKETLQQQVRRELAYREQLAKQLQLVKENLYQELEQERKTRCTLQQNLKETHDALHRFSCKMLASRHCQECVFKTAQLQKEMSAQLQQSYSGIKQ
ncbi:SKI family transcriptional corepressor 1 homolog-B-like [Tubulanus polymorphus]|uniref:SKI family transcriptional corepressor 1 homolog-B-like n=1 Tax=Tubulanus polymorphus TaxID=672921 RepID=UPI003DA5714F